jgi:hypothetical protein
VHGMPLLRRCFLVSLFFLESNSLHSKRNVSSSVYHFCPLIEHLGFLVRARDACRNMFNIFVLKGYFLRLVSLWDYNGCLWHRARYLGPNFIYASPICRSSFKFTYNSPRVPLYPVYSVHLLILGGKILSPTHTWNSCSMLFHSIPDIYYTNSVQEVTKPEKHWEKSHCSGTNLDSIIGDSLCFTNFRGPPKKSDTGKRGGLPPDL